MKGKCAKVTVKAIIIKDGKYWLGTNWCKNPQKVCPRQGMPTGEGYELCKRICQQNSHAEIDACIKAGISAKNADLFLIGHDYCCIDCKKVMQKFGIKNIYICRKV